MRGFPTWRHISICGAKLSSKLVTKDSARIITPYFYMIAMSEKVRNRCQRYAYDSDYKKMFQCVMIPSSEPTMTKADSLILICSRDSSILVRRAFAIVGLVIEVLVHVTAQSKQSLDCCIDSVQLKTFTKYNVSKFTVIYQENSVLYVVNSLRKCSRVTAPSCPPPLHHMLNG